jgi:hypothetical protein
MRATTRFRWLAIAPIASVPAVVLSAVLSVVLSVVLSMVSQLALAHGGHHHQQETAPATAWQMPEAVTAGRTAPHSAAAAWSSSCPDGSGGECCCKHQPSTPSPDKAVLVNFGGWTRPASRISAPPVNWPRELLAQQSSVSPALPRAPPLFS